MGNVIVMNEAQMEESVSLIGRSQNNQEMVANNFNTLNLCKNLNNNFTRIIAIIAIPIIIKSSLSTNENVSLNHFTIASIYLPPL